MYLAFLFLKLTISCVFAAQKKRATKVARSKLSLFPTTQPTQQLSGLIIIDEINMTCVLVLEPETLPQNEIAVKRQPRLSSLLPWHKNQ